MKMPVFPGCHRFVASHLELSGDLNYPGAAGMLTPRSRPKPTRGRACALICIIAILLVGCATTAPKPPSDDVCYSKAENAKLHGTMEELSDTIDDLHARAREERRRDGQWRTRNEGLKGYCT